MKDKGDSGLLIALGGPEKSGMKSSGMKSGMGDMMSEEPSENPDMDEVESMATDDLFTAIESGDREAGKDALSRFVKACIAEHFSKDGY